jgi:hypothetical protein
MRTLLAVKMSFTTLIVFFRTVELFGDLLWQGWGALGVQQSLTKFDINLIPNRKTQIAIEFAYRLREKSPESPVFWVHASNASRIELSYRAIAAAAKLPGADDPKTDILNMVLRWLENGINRP